MVTYWDSGFGPGNWVIWKNVFVCIFGVLALVFGTKDSIDQIIKLYTPEALNSTLDVIATNATIGFNTTS